MKVNSTIVLVIVWFGPWPFWMPAFLLSCRYNPEVEWRIFTDTPAPPEVPANVKFVSLTLDTFNQRASTALGFEVSIQPEFVYKLCDLKIAYGEIFRAELDHFDFWGCCDLDIVWGKIRCFISQDILDNYDIITSRPVQIAGHFCLFRNTDKWYNFFRRIPDIQCLMSGKEHVATDEVALSELLTGYNSSFLRRLWTTRFLKLPVPRVYYGPELTTRGRYLRRMLADRELFARWENGHTYGVDGEELMYLHIHKIRHTMRGIDFGYADRPKAFKVSPDGFAVVK